MGAFSERYALQMPLGESSIGNVWTALDRSSDARVVVLRLGEQTTEATLERFRRHAKALCAVRHPNVVRGLDQGDDEDGAPYLVVELLEGESLASRWASTAMTVERLVDVAVQVAEGLGALHAAGICHGDIEPGNVFLSGPRGQEVPKLIGVALNRSHARAGVDGERTSVASMHQMYAYAAPEQVRGEVIDAVTADLYSLAAVVYAGLAGRPPFVAPTVMALLEAVTRGKPPTLASIRKDLAAFSATLDRALASEPTRRFPDAHALARALRTCLVLGKSVAAKEIPVGPRSPIGQPAAAVVVPKPGAASAGGTNPAPGAPKVVPRPGKATIVGLAPVPVVPVGTASAPAADPKRAAPPPPPEHGVGAQAPRAEAGERRAAVPPPTPDAAIPERDSVEFEEYRTTELPVPAPAPEAAAQPAAAPSVPPAELDVLVETDASTGERADTPETVGTDAGGAEVMTAAAPEAPADVAEPARGRAEPRADADAPAGVAEPARGRASPRADADAPAGVQVVMATERAVAEAPLAGAASSVQTQVEAPSQLDTAPAATSPSEIDAALLAEDEPLAIQATAKRRSRVLVAALGAAALVAFGAFVASRGSDAGADADTSTTREPGVPTATADDPTPTTAPSPTAAVAGPTPATAPAAPPPAAPPPAAGEGPASAPPPQAAAEDVASAPVSPTPAAPVPTVAPRPDPAAASPTGASGSSSPSLRARTPRPARDANRPAVAVPQTLRRTRAAATSRHPSAGATSAGAPAPARGRRPTIVTNPGF